MAGDIEDPLRLSFQGDSWQSGSISFGRFENESLCWERRSSFTHNRYLEEVEKYSKPGSVTEKKAYFEARLRKKALLRQSSSEWQNGTESQASENDGPENASYEGDFVHVNEIGHSARFVENHDRSANSLENEKYLATENEGYAGDFEHVNKDGHSACFDENIDRSIHSLKNGKYQSENTGYDGDFERVNEVGHSARFEESLDGSHNGDIEVTECDGEDSIILHSGHSGPQIEQATNSSDVLQSVPEHMEAEANFHPNAGNSTFDNDPKPEIEVKEKLEGQDSSMEFSSNSVDLSSNAHTTEKDGSVSSEPLRRSSSKMRAASQSRDTKSRMLSQVSVASGKGSISKQAYKDMPSKPNRRNSDVSLTRKGEKLRLDAPAALLHPTARMPKPEVCSGSKANVLEQKSTEQQPRAKKAVASRASCTEKVSHRVHQCVNRDKQSVNACNPGMKQNESGFLFKSEERAKKRKEFLMKLEEKMHAVEAEKHQLQARTQVKKEAELKQLRRNLNFKATPMPAFYHEPGRRSDRNKELASKTKSSKLQSRPSTSGARATAARENTGPCSTAEIDNRCSTKEHLNVADSPQVSEVTNHPSAELSDSSVPSSAPTNKTSWQTRSNRTVAPKREQEKRQVLNSPRPRTADTNKGFKTEEKTKVVARRVGNNAMRKDIRSIDLSRSTRVGHVAVGVAS